MFPKLLLEIVESETIPGSGGSCKDGTAFETVSGIELFVGDNIWVAVDTGQGTIHWPHWKSWSAMFGCVSKHQFVIKPPTQPNPYKDNPTQPNPDKD